MREYVNRQITESFRIDKEKRKVEIISGKMQYLKLLVINFFLGLSILFCIKTKSTSKIIRVNNSMIQNITCFRKHYNRELNAL